MAADWYVAKIGGQPVGPLTPLQVKQMAEAGQLQGSDLVWKEGLPQWVPASQVKGLLSGSGTAIPAATPSATPAPAPSPPPSAERPAPVPGSDEAPADGGRDPWYYGFLETYAKVFLWLGIAACVLGFLGFLVPAIYVTFVQASSQAAREGTSAPFLQAVVVVLAALLVFGLTVLALVFWTALVLLAVDAGRSLRSLNRRASRK
jgi:hypothetical protein